MRNKRGVDKMNKGWDRDSIQLEGHCCRRRRGVDNWREDAFEELDMTANAFIRLLELRIESQHAQKTAPAGAHN